MANTQIVLLICMVILSWARLDIVAYWLAIQGRFPGVHLLQIIIFFFLFRIVMQNYFIQVISNYINDKHYTPLILNYSKIFGGGLKFGPPER